MNKLIKSNRGGLEMKSKDWIFLAPCAVGGAILGTCLYIGYRMMYTPSETINKWPSDYGLLYEDVSFDGPVRNKGGKRLMLSGWWIPAQEEGVIRDSRYTVILSHGYHNVRTLEGIALFDLVKQMSADGYHVLMYDFRHCGFSEGRMSTGGYLERYDLLAAIRYVKKEKHCHHIVLMGWSMGAAVSIMAGAMAKEVRGIIADSPYADLKHYLYENMSRFTKLPSFPFSYLTVGLTKHWLRMNIKEASPLEAAKQLGKRPLLLIHAEGDEVIPYKDTLTIYEAIKEKGKVDYWVPTVQGHIRAYIHEKKAYEEKVLNFLHHLAYPKRRHCQVKRIVGKY